MWKCHKCGKPVYFAERKQSLGYDWHPECLRCEECGKRLDPGQHAEHKGVPYCHVPCYGALFGPQLFGHGTRVESHKSFGQKASGRVSSGPPLPRSHLEVKLKAFNQYYYDGKSSEIKSREVNGRLILEGALRIHWGVQGVIHLKEDDDQRTVVTVRKRNSVRINNGLDEDKYSDDEELTENSPDQSISDTGIESGCDTTDISNTSLNSTNNVERNLKTVSSLTLPPKLDVKNLEWDELDDLLQVERKVDETEKLYQTMPVPLRLHNTQENSTQNSEAQNNDAQCLDSQNLETSVQDISLKDVDEQDSEVQKKLDCSNLEEQNNVRNNINEIENKMLKNKELPNRSLVRDDSWIEKGLLLNRSMSGPDCLERNRKHDSDCDSISDDSGNHDTSDKRDLSPIDPSVTLRRPAKTGSTAIRRRSGKRRSRTKIKRRCSINGHFYNRETSFFTPPYGSHMSVWVTSLVNTQEVINLMLEKYKVDSDPNNFALFVVRDNGEQRKLRDEEYPLLVRVLLGPHEDVCKLYIMDRHSTPEVSNAVAQFLNLSLPECRAIIDMYTVEEEREIMRVKEKYIEMRKRIKQRTEELKVRL